MPEQRRYAYHYARIDETGYCYEVIDTTECYDGVAGCVAIPTSSDDYLEKYYNVADDKWYYDADFTNEWTPA